MNKILLTLIYVCTISSCVTKIESYSTFKNGESDPGFYLMYSMLSTSQQISSDEHFYVNLVNQKGEVVHQWDPHCPTVHAELFENMRLAVVCYKKISYLRPIGTHGQFKYIDKNSNLIWTYEEPSLHHGFAKLNDNQFFFLKNRLLTKADVMKLNLPISLQGPDTIWTGQAILVNSDGKTTWQWDFINDLSKHALKQLVFRSYRDLTHENSIRYYPTNALNHKPCVLISSRHASAIILIDFETKKPLWISTVDVGRLQHDAILVNESKIVFFDNGPRNADWRSAIKEIDITTNKERIIFQNILFAIPFMGAVQPLLNNHYLITNSVLGYGFEIDSNSNRVFSITNRIQKLPQTTGLWWNIAPIFKIQKYDLSFIKDSK